MTRKLSYFIFSGALSLTSFVSASSPFSDLRWSPQSVCKNLKSRGLLTPAEECDRIARLGHYFTGEAIVLCWKMVEKNDSPNVESGQSSADCMASIVNKAFKHSEIEVCEGYLKQDGLEKTNNCLKTSGRSISVIQTIDYPASEEEAR